MCTKVYFQASPGGRLPPSDAPRRSRAVSGKADSLPRPPPAPGPSSPSHPPSAGLQYRSPRRDSGVPDCQSQPAAVSGSVACWDLDQGPPTPAHSPWDAGETFTSADLGERGAVPLPMGRERSSLCSSIPHPLLCFQGDSYSLFPSPSLPSRGALTGRERTKPRSVNSQQERACADGPREARSGTVAWGGVIRRVH